MSAWLSLLTVVGTAPWSGPWWQELLDVLLFRGRYNTTSVVAGTALLGVAGGVVGVFALLRKRALVCDALSHATLPGICASFLLADLLLGDAKSLPVLLLGASVSGILGVVCVQGLVRFTRLREDASIGIVLSVFFGLGIVLLGIVPELTSTPAGGINHFIYGQTAAMGRADAYLMGGIALAAVVGAALLLKEFSLVSFDEGFARVTGWKVWLIDGLMMGLVVAVTVAGLQAVGLLLVVAMLIVPPAGARFWSERLPVVVVLAGVIGGMSGLIGSAISAQLPDAPAGAVIVLTGGALFGVSMLLAPKRGVLAAAIRRLRLRLQVASDHVLERLIEDEDAGGHERSALHPVREVFTGLLLRAGGFARREGGALALTERGRLHGRRIRRNHRLWEQYLVSYADVAPSHVDWSVDRVEHVLSEGLVEELENALRARGVWVDEGEPA